MAPPSLLDVPDLDGWAAQWDQLVDSSPLPSPFLRSWWLTGAGGPGRHFVLVVDGARLLGGLAVEERRRMLSVRVMGDGSLCPDHLDLLATSGHEAAVVGLLRDWLCRPGGRLLDLKGIRAGSRLIQALPDRVHREPMAVAPFTRLPDSPEAYRATLPKQFRTNLRGAAKRLAAEGVTHQAIRGQAVLQRLDTLRELHRSQWGSRSGFLPVFDRFAAGFAGGCAADEVVVHELRNDGLVVAIVAVFEVAGRVSVYQGARLTDGRWRDAGTFLLAAIVDDACARGLNEVDFLRGDEPYKGRFAPNHRVMLRLVAGKGVVGRFSGGSKAATSQARQTAVRCVRFGRSTVARWKALQANFPPLKSARSISRGLAVPLLRAIQRRPCRIPIAQGRVTPTNDARSSESSLMASRSCQVVGPVGLANGSANSSWARSGRRARSPSWHSGLRLPRPSASLRVRVLA